MNDTDRRKTLGKLLVTSTLGFTGIGGTIRRVLAAGSAPIRPGLQQIIGHVTVNGKVAESGMLVGPGDTVVSEANSQAIYVIGQDAFLQRAGSTVTFSGDSSYTAQIVSTSPESGTQTVKISGKWLQADCGNIKPIALPQSK